MGAGASGWCPRILGGAAYHAHKVLGLACPGFRRIGSGPALAKHCDRRTCVLPCHGSNKPAGISRVRHRLRPNPYPYCFHVGVIMRRKSITLLGVAGLFLGVLYIGQQTRVTRIKVFTIDKMSISEARPHSSQDISRDNCAACHGFDGTAKGLAVPFFEAPPPRRMGQRLFDLLNKFQEAKIVLMPHQAQPARIVPSRRATDPHSTQ